jgi:pilus assembly protein CpaE
VALRKANALFVIIVPEMTSLHTVKQFVETMTATLPEVGLNIVLNRATLPGGVPTEAIRRHLRLQIAVELPDEQELVTTSVNRGVPFVIGHPRSGLAKAINVLADELAPGRGEARDAGKSGLTKSMSPLGRLLNRGRAR